MSPRFSIVGRTSEIGIGRVPAQQLELDLVRRLVARAGTGPCAGPTGSATTRSSARDVVHGDFERRVLLVGGREGVAPGAVEPQRLGLAVGVEQRVLELVLPGADRLRDAALELDGVDAAVGIRRRAHQHVQPREHGLRQRHLRFDRRAAEGLERELLDALARLRVVAVARHVDEAGIEAAERVAAHEQAHLRALVEVHDAAHDADEVRHGRLEQLVARERLERVHERLVVVARGLQAGSGR